MILFFYSHDTTINRCQCFCVGKKTQSQKSSTQRKRQLFFSFRRAPLLFNRPKRPQPHPLVSFWLKSLKHMMLTQTQMLTSMQSQSNHYMKLMHIFHNTCTFTFSQIAFSLSEYYVLISRLIYG